jgi:hypothetical protein
MESPARPRFRCDFANCDESRRITLTLGSFYTVLYYVCSLSSTDDYSSYKAAEEEISERRV